MKIVVTGGMGFIGQEIIQQLLEAGHDVVCVDFFQELLLKYEKFKFPILKSVYETISKCQSVFEPHEFIEDCDIHSAGVDVIIHCGANSSTTDLSPKLFESNVDYTKLLVSKVRKCYHTPRFVFISSAAVYGTDGFANNPYGLTKKIGENIVTNNLQNYAIVRPFNVFGKNEHHKGDMASVPFKIDHAIKNKNRFELHSWKSSRDFVPVTRVANKIIECVMSKETVICDAGVGESMSFGSLAMLIAKINKVHLPETQIVEADFPENLVGRYQHNTCATIPGFDGFGGTRTTAYFLHQYYEKL